MVVMMLIVCDDGESKVDCGDEADEGGGDNDDDGVDDDTGLVLILIMAMIFLVFKKDFIGCHDSAKNCCKNKQTDLDFCLNQKKEIHRSSHLLCCS